MAEFILLAKETVKVVLLTKEKGEEHFTIPDEFVLSMSEFDRQARMQSATPVSVVDYLAFLRTTVLDWDEESIETIRLLIELLNTRPGLKHLHFPSPVYIILTNGKDESESAYTRHDDMIVLPLKHQDHFDSIRATGDAQHIQQLTNGHEWFTTISHELFHLWSKNNMVLKNKLYNIIDYHEIGHVTKLPRDKQHLVITNPDYVKIEHYIRLKRISSQQITNLAPVLVAKSKYTGGSFFDYLLVRFQVLDEKLQETDELLPYSDFLGFEEAIGKNTSYTIAPEEIMADNFVIYLHETDPSQVKSYWIIEKLKTILTE